MASTRQQPARYPGVFPVVPTIFDAHGGLDREGQKRCVDFMIDAGSSGLRIPILIQDAIEEPWDGEEAITLLADLDAGATGAMTGGAYPDGIRTIVDAYAAGCRSSASRTARADSWPPRPLMKEGGIIACDAPLRPYPPMMSAGIDLH